MMRYNFENLEVRQLISDKGVFYYQLARKMGISSCTLSVWLREPLSKEQKQLILNALETF